MQYNLSIENGKAHMGVSIFDLKGSVYIKVTEKEKTSIFCCPPDVAEVISSFITAASTDAERFEENGI